MNRAQQLSSPGLQEREGGREVREPYTAQAEDRQHRGDAWWDVSFIPPLSSSFTLNWTSFQGPVRIRESTETKTYFLVLGEVRVRRLHARGVSIIDTFPSPGFSFGELGWGQISVLTPEREDCTNTESKFGLNRIYAKDLRAFN